MSGQCLSSSVPGHALTPGRHRRLGEPLPHQLPNTTKARPRAESHLWSQDDAISRHRWELPAVSRGYAQLQGWLPSHYSPLRHSQPKLCVRLACLIHAANVHSEPGSNPSKYASCVRKRRNIPQRHRRNARKLIHRLMCRDGKGSFRSYYG